MYNNLHSVIIKTFHGIPCLHLPWYNRIWKTRKNSWIVSRIENTHSYSQQQICSKFSNRNQHLYFPGHVSRSWSIKTVVSEARDEFFLVIIWQIVVGDILVTAIKGIKCAVLGCTMSGQTRCQAQKIMSIHPRPARIKGNGVASLVFDL